MPGRILGFVALTLLGLGCPSSAPEPERSPVATVPSSEPKPVPPQAAKPAVVRPAAEPPSDCRAYVPEGTARCCFAPRGFEPDAVVAACGLDAYLGQNEDWSCVHSFRTKSGKEFRVRVTDLAPLSLSAAVERHRSSFRPNQPQALRGELPGLPGSLVSEYKEWTWAFVPGGRRPFRAAWPTRGCSAEALAPVLAKMSQADPGPTLARPMPVFGAPSSSPPAEPSLLDQYAKRQTPDPDEFDKWLLPYKSKRMVVVMLIAAAHGDTSYLAKILTEDARFGLPTRRELGAQSILSDDGGARFLEAFARAARRLGANATWTTRPLMPAASKLVEQGAAPMWAMYDSPDHLDRIVFRLQVVEGRAAIDYVGFFDPRPSAVPGVFGEPPEPPSIPTVKLADGRLVFESEAGKVVSAKVSEHEQPAR